MYCLLTFPCRILKSQTFLFLFFQVYRVNLYDLRLDLLVKSIHGPNLIIIVKPIKFRCRVLWEVIQATTMHMLLLGELDGLGNNLAIKGELG